LDLPGVDLRIIAAEEVIDSVERVLADEGVAVARSGILDPSYMGLDLSTIADLAAVVSVALISDPILPTLWQWLKPESRTRIVIETPFARVVLDSREALTEAEVKKKLEQLVGVLK
jgi:hypothetical protein